MVGGVVAQAVPFGEAPGISGLAPAMCVRKPAIAEVLDRDDGRFLEARGLIEGHLYQDIIALRVRLRERIAQGDPLYVCAHCYTPVYLVSRAEARHFFFRHVKEDPESCPAQTRLGLSAEAILARKYHGLRESKPHRDIKALIERSLAADPSFSDIAAETTWRSAGPSGDYRRPDIQAVRDATRYAFEVQLSTTFLSVVAGRREFYRREGALLVWVLGGFDPDYRRLTIDDLLFSNNSNVLIVDVASTRRSEETGTFHIRCVYREPYYDGERLTELWDDIVIPFAWLTQDVEKQAIFWFDYAAREAREREKMALALEREEAEQRAQAAHLVDLLRRDFFEFWEEHANQFRHSSENRSVWRDIRMRFGTQGVNLPEWPDADGEVRALLNMLFSLQQDRPIGWKFTKLIQIAHTIAENHPSLLAVLGFAIQHYGRGPALVEQDGSQKWAKRMEEFRAAIRARDPAYLPDRRHLPLIGILFPEIGQRLTSFMG